MVGLRPTRARHNAEALNLLHISFVTARTKNYRRLSGPPSSLVRAPPLRGNYIQPFTLTCIFSYVQFFLDLFFYFCGLLRVWGAGALGV